MKSKYLLLLFAVSLLIVAGCDANEVLVPELDPDDVDAPEVNVPEVDANVDLPDVDFIPGNIDVDWPALDFTGGNFDVNVNTTSNEGRVVFAYKESQSEIMRISSVFVTTDGTHIHSPRGVEPEGDSWEEIWMFEEEVDLLELGAEDRIQLTSDDWDDAGTYDMFRIDLSEVVIDDWIGRDEAYTPREEVLVMQDFQVVQGETTLILLDFDLAQSIRLANRGSDDERYVFLPVFTVDVYQNAQISGDDENLVIEGQPTSSSKVMGMDANGEIVAGIPVGWNYDVNFDIQTEEITVEVPTVNADADFDASSNVRGADSDDYS